MDVSSHLPLEELVRLERIEKDAARSKRLRLVILAISGYTAPTIAMSVGLSRRICQRWVARYNETDSFCALNHVHLTANRQNPLRRCPVAAVGGR